MESQQNKPAEKGPPAGTDAPSEATADTGVSTTAEPEPMSPPTTPPDAGTSVSDAATTIVPSGSGAGRKKGWLAPAMITVGVIALLALVYLYSAYLQSRPTAVYSASLAKTGDALDALVGYSGSVAQQHYKSYDVSSDLQITGNDTFEAVASGTVDTNGDSLLTAHADLFGEKLSANIKSVQAAGSIEPDVYIQPSGIKRALNDLGFDSPNNLDGQWFVIDHSMVKSYLTNLNPGISSIAKGATLPSAAQIHDAMQKVQVVNRQYIFTSDSNRSVLTSERFVDEEIKDGRDTYRYHVGYNKAHLVAYANALGVALDKSSLNTWSQAANGGKSLSQVLDIESLKKTAASGTTTQSFTAWVDTQTRLIHAVQFAGPTDNSVAFTISQDYTGGDVYPIGLDVTNGNQETSLSLSIDTATDSYVGTLMGQGGDDDTTLNFTLIPSTKTVSVTAPSGAQPISDALTELGVPSSGSLLQPGSSSNATL